ncbi:helix-turn-helix domain-containing protein [Desulfopila aestuarii]|uniref:helix-turn-helix domain-containing protein n=1 Tax=Desulfopila aestuarii TaxID=231440 RepID=UPI00190EA35E
MCYYTGIKTQDARSLSQELQQYNRDQAVRLSKKGKSRRDIADIIGVSYSAVCNWIKAWKNSGRQATGKRSKEARKNLRIPKDSNGSSRKSSKAIAC